MAALLLLAVVGCGGQQASQTSPTPAASAVQPTAAVSPTAFAVVEGGSGAPNLPNSAHNRVAIVNLDGSASAKQNFRSRGLPKIGDAEPILPLEAAVADGRVYYVDGLGVVRALTPDGRVTEAARLPLITSQQVLSFAVSPDGTRLMATIFSWPPVHDPPPRSITDEPFAPGDFSLDVFAMAPGQAVSPVAHRAWPQTPPLPADVLQLVGWSSRGPLASVDTELGTQNANFAERIFGRVAELDTNGHPGTILGGEDCMAKSILPDETVLCTNAGFSVASVRTRDGAIIYNVQSPGQQYFQALTLAPDGGHVAYIGGVSARTGPPVALPRTFVPEGWMDADTIVGAQSATGGHMGLIKLESPSRITDLGFNGYFVGPL
jgi:hypothetical protein